MRRVRPSAPGEGCGQGATSSRGYIGCASGRGELRPNARMTITLILENGGKFLVQSIFNHHEPSRGHRAIPGHEPIRRQPAAHWGSFPTIRLRRGRTAAWSGISARCEDRNPWRALPFLFVVFATGPHMKILEHPESYLVNWTTGRRGRFSPATYTTHLHGCRPPSCGFSR